eukprot:c10413_g1_i1.p1 GENE.c10413_g1_i1~~c10413_g1_i1.p1  ORF type:complete len:247 (-),score=72.24 c10413_g1_i1:238-978(-)
MIPTTATTHRRTATSLFFLFLLFDSSLQLQSQTHLSAQTHTTATTTTTSHLTLTAPTPTPTPLPPSRGKHVLHNPKRAEFYVKWGLSLVLAEMVADYLQNGSLEPSFVVSCDRSPMMFRYFLRALGLYVLCAMWRTARGDNWDEQARQLDVWGRWLVSLFNFLAYFDHIWLCLLVVFLLRAARTRARCPIAGTPPLSIAIAEAFLGPLIDFVRNTVPMLDFIMQVNRVTQKVGLGRDDSNSNVPPI